MPTDSPHAAPESRLRRAFFSGPILLAAFALAVMAAPVSSVAYAIGAALRALDGDLALLLPTIGMVVAPFALAISNHHQLVARFPAFGGGWAFIPIGALIASVAFTLIVNLSRGDPIASLAAASLIALVLYRFRVRVDRPRGIAQAVVEAER